MLVKKHRMFYGYIVVIAGFLIMMIVHGTFNTFGVFFNPLLEEFGTSRATLSGASSLAFFLTGFMAIFVGILTDRFGPRIVMTVFVLLFGAGHLLMSTVGSVWQIYAFYIIVGIGLSASDVVPLATVVRWFAKKRGMMSGIMKVGTGLGMMTMPLVVNGLISSFDWRSAYIVLGILVLAIALPASQLLKRDPRHMGLLPDSEKQQSSVPDLGEEGLSFREAIHTWQLWTTCGMYLAILFCAQSILVHIVPHSIDLGLSAAKAAGVAATIGGVSMIGRLVMGFSGDRIGYKQGVVICFLILVAALSWLQFARTSWMVYLFAAVYGFNHGGFFALLSPVIAELFGTRSQGTLLGIVIFSGTIGGSLGPFLAGTIFDTTGSYRLSFIILLVVAIVGLILTASLKPIDERRQV